MRQRRIFGLAVAFLALGGVALSVALFVPERAQSPGISTDAAGTSSDVANGTQPTPQGVVTANDDNNEAFNTDNQPVLSKIQQPAPAFPRSLVIQPRHRQTAYAVDAGTIIQGVEYPLRRYNTLMSPNDPLASQWWTGATQLNAAWDVSVGTSDVTIAIIDTGFALAHEEFTGRWHQNQGELGTAASEAPSRLNCADRGLAVAQHCNLVDDDLDGAVDNETGPTTYQNPSIRNCTYQSRPLAKDCNNVDDDGNGFIDDVTGWDFINQDRSVQAGQLNPTGVGTTHGTRVAGVAAATGNNGVGIAGVNWAARILPIQALDDDGYGDTVSVGQSILYAVQQGADVINLSLGTPFHDPFVQQAIETAVRAGIIVVAAAGNDGCNCLSYPARYPEVVAVGALSPTGAPATFSSYGSELDILAPGQSMTTSSWSAGNPTNSYASGVAGTSFASPYVAGILATLRSLRPTAVPLQVIAAIGETSQRPIGMAPTPHDARYGHGVVQAAAALNRMVTPATDPQIYRFVPISKGAFLSPSSPYEAVGTYGVHDCNHLKGTTPIYELSKAGITFHTISKLEMQRAVSQGYRAALFAYGCVNQPHDTHQIIRQIDIFKEFKNDYSRRP